MKTARKSKLIQREGGATYIEPCLAVPASVPPTGPEWIAEIKYDGYRVQAHLASNDVTLLSRSGQDWTSKFARIHEAVSNLRATSAIIDGEAIVENARGIPDFHALQREIKKGPSARISLVAFDLLELDGDDLRSRSLIERKRALEALLGASPESPFLRFSADFAENGGDVMQHVCELGIEGIVCKRVDRPYRSGPSDDWIKVKCILSEPFVVGGYVPLKAQNESVGALSLGYFRNDALVYVGRVGTGFSAQEASDMWQALQLVRRKTSPFATPLERQQKTGVVWVEPQLVVEIAHRGWTHDDVLRHSVFQRFRLDLSSSDVGVPASLRGSG